MSRSNPYKRKRRQAKKTVLFYCEGADDKVFLEYIKSIFARDTGIAVTIKENHGGSANDVLYNVLRQSKTDEMYCVYDIDTGVDPKIKKKVSMSGIICLENKPCLEAMLLQILENKDYSRQLKCGNCKRLFESKYLNDKKRKDKRNYKKLFSKKILQQKAKEIENLKVIIDVMSDK